MGLHGASENWILEGASDDFYLYGEKEPENQNLYSYLQKCAQVVLRLCETLPKHMEHNVFFDNWFTNWDWMLFLKKDGCLVAESIRSNHVQGCPVIANKYIAKKSWGSSDHRVEIKSGINIIKWKDNSVVQILSNLAGIEPLDSMQLWDRTENQRKIYHAPKLSKHAARVWSE